MLHTHFFLLCGFGNISKNTNMNLSGYLQVYLSKQCLLTVLLQSLQLRFSDKAIIFDRASSLAYWRTKASPSVHSTKTCSVNTLFLYDIVL